MNNRIYYSQEAEQMMQRQKAVAIVLFASLGLGLGAALALLFAPDKGENTRRSLLKSVEERVDSTAEGIRKLEQDMADMRERIEERRM